MISFELEGIAADRKALGAKASARVGDATVEWTSYADGLKEDIVLDSRPAKDEVRFKVEMQRLSPVRDRQGGYVLYDSYSHPRFHVLAPTVQDAKGRTIYQEDGTSAPLVERIAFDIAVTMSAPSEGGGESVRVAVLNPSKRKSEALAPAESRIRFEIPILLPFGDPPD